MQISNKAALQLILEGEISINDETIKTNREFGPEDEVKYRNEILQSSQNFETFAFYKPRGIECTLNTQIVANLKEILPFSDDFFPVGRLDKASEGLLLITNDGRIYDKILRKEFDIEKEYRVDTDRKIDDDFINKMQNGIKIMGKTTLPCFVENSVITHLK